jgi:transmembrane sensor
VTRQESEARKWAKTMHGKPSDADRRAFNAWHSEPVNAEAYARAKDEWDFTGTMSPDRIKADRRHFQSEAKARRMRWAVPTTAAVLLVLGAGWYIQHSGDEPRLAQNQSAAGEQMLSDGTRVTLMDGARIETRFSTGRRLLILTGGRARFEVAHDAARPFTVVAGRSETTALGTIFEVDAREITPRIKLIRGSVEVRSRAGGEALRLAPGESAEVPETGPRRLPAMGSPVVTPAPATLLVADHLPLGAVLDSAGKSGAKPIRLADPTLASLPVTGSFDVSAGAALARKLAAALDLHVDEQAGEIILRKK